jgi:hypothetical protein
MNGSINPLLYEISIWAIPAVGARSVADPVNVGHISTS